MIEELEPLTTYKIKLQSYNDVGDGPSSKIILIETPPGFISSFDLAADLTTYANTTIKYSKYKLPYSVICWQKCFGKNKNILYLVCCHT